MVRVFLVARRLGVWPGVRIMRGAQSIPLKHLGPSDVCGPALCWLWSTATGVVTLESPHKVWGCIRWTSTRVLTKLVLNSLLWGLFNIQSMNLPELFIVGIVQKIIHNYNNLNCGDSVKTYWWISIIIQHCLWQFKITLCFVNWYYLHNFQNILNISMNYNQTKIQ